jgi:hypothetical protein
MIDERNTRRDEHRLLDAFRRIDDPQARDALLLVACEAAAVFDDDQAGEPTGVVLLLTRPEYFALRSLVAEHLLCPRRSEVYITPVPEHVEVTPEELLTKLMEIDDEA